ncbi:hypothetical protein EBO15_14650 [Actinomadura harenae]|uniref:Carboxypeptidase regulatory-like domain-containing protein n=1 Tax=Actinomadura harenae TaxID=2483351 RepID=A0A3M2M300_9ACTN|nr:hypothetical protein EBO15_14650 [Actinomadura harenae]
MTQIVETAASTDHLDYDHRQVTLSGRLMQQQADGTLAPLPEHTVRVFAGNYSRDEASTDADGRFTVTMIDPGYRVLTACSDDDDTYAESCADYRFTITQRPTRLSLNPLPASSKLGSWVSVSGHAEVLTSAGWGPIAGVIGVAALNSPLNNLGAMRVEADGGFSGKIQIRDGASWAATLYPDALEYDQRNSTPPTPIRTVHPTSTWLYAPQSRPVPGRPFNFRVSTDAMRFQDAQYELLAPWPLPDEPFKLYFRPDSGGQPRLIASGRTGRDGDALIAHTPKVGERGTWFARIDPSGDLTGSVSTNVHLDVRYATTLRLSAKPDPVRKGRRLTAHGTLLAPGGKALGKRTVKIYFQARGSKKWVGMATVHTDAHGAFTRTFTAKQDGTWHAAFAGDTLDLPVQAADYVDVR